MIISFGAHRGESIKSLVLDEPGYVAWMRDETNPSPMLVRAQLEISRVIRDFDARPFTCSCDGFACTRPATYCTLREGTISPWWWCDKCSPGESYAPNKLTMIRTYFAAVQYVRWFRNSREADMKFLVNELAKAKGIRVRGLPSILSDFLW